MKRFMGVWEIPFYSFEITIGKALRLLRDSREIEFNALLEKLIRRQPPLIDLDISDRLLNDLLFGSVYREQALVLCVTAFEVYLKRKREEIMNKSPQSIPEELDELNFQCLNDCEEFGVLIGVPIFKNSEKESLEEPFQDRHIITHNGSLIDSRWVRNLGKPEKLADMRQKQILSYGYVQETIKNIYSIISHLEEEVNRKFSIDYPRSMLIEDAIKEM